MDAPADPQSDPQRAPRSDPSSDPQSPSGPLSGPQRAPQPDPRTGPQPDPRRWLGLIAALSAPFLGVVDFFVVNLALPALEQDLGATWAQQELSIALYGLGSAVLVVTGGRLGDTHGRRRMFLLGLAAFTLSSCLCALAPSAWTFLLGRLLQGISTALVFPQVLALIAVSFPEHERPRAFAWFGLTVALASITGQLASGLLLHLDPFGLGWRALFLINLPIGAAALLLARRTLKEVRTSDPPTLDLPGVGVATLLLLCVLVPLTLGHEQGWPAWAGWMLAAAPALAWLFLRLERATARRGRDALVDPALLKLVGYRRGLAMIGCYFLGMASVYLLLSLFQQQGLARDPLTAALTFLPGAVATLIGSLLAARHAARLPWTFLSWGLAGVLAGLALLVAALALADGWQRDLGLAAGLALFGLGNASVSPVVYTTILSGVPARSAGSAAGVLATVQQVSAALGVALIGLVFAHLLAQGSGSAGHARAAAWALALPLLTMAGAALLAQRLPRARH